jgi:hypothetical protein
VGNLDSSNFATTMGTRASAVMLEVVMVGTMEAVMVEEH